VRLSLMTLISALGLALLTASAAREAQPNTRVAVLASPRFGALSPVAHVTWDGYLDEIGVADVTGDGNPDVVGVKFLDGHASESHPLVILAGNGKGGFKDVTSQIFVGPVPRTQHARRLIFADFNGDGRPDFLIADHGNDNPPFDGFPNALVLSAPGGKLVDASANLPRTADYTHSAAVGDVDGNGTIDIYAGNLWEGWDGGTEVPPEILLNDGTGHFHILADALPADLTVNALHYDGSALVDVNGDGRPDLVLAGSPQTPDKVFLNDGSGHFHELAGALPPKPFAPDAEGLDIAPIDLNGDGHTDLLMAFTKNNPFYVGRWIQVLINKGDGTFRNETATRLPQKDNSLAWPYALRVADLNGDGKPDLAVAVNAGDTSATPPIYLNKGDGTFKPLQLGSSPYPILDLADVNRDRRLDIISAEPGGQGSIDTYAVNLQKKPPKPKRKCVKRPHHPCHK
jgi:FG-GAP-like repeat